MTEDRAGTDSPIVLFHSGRGTDDRGRTLDEILGWDDGRLEAVHDYIQWLFPLPERSAFNPGAPLLTEADIAAFRRKAALRRALLASLGRMRAFYGLAPARTHKPWLSPGNHNLLRLTRILRCLTVLGVPEEAAALLVELEACAGSVAGPVTLDYWRRAVR